MKDTFTINGIDIKAACSWAQGSSEMIPLSRSVLRKAEPI